MALKDNLKSRKYNLEQSKSYVTTPDLRPIQDDLELLANNIDTALELAGAIDLSEYLPLSGTGSEVMSGPVVFDYQNNTKNTIASDYLLIEHKSNGATSNLNLTGLENHYANGDSFILTADGLQGTVDGISYNYGVSGLSLDKGDDNHFNLTEDELLLSSNDGVSVAEYSSNGIVINSAAGDLEIYPDSFSFENAAFNHTLGEQQFQMLDKTTNSAFEFTHNISGESTIARKDGVTGAYLTLIFPESISTSANLTLQPLTGYVPVQSASLLSDNRILTSDGDGKIVVTTTEYENGFFKFANTKGIKWSDTEYISNNGNTINIAADNNLEVIIGGSVVFTSSALFEVNGTPSINLYATNNVNIDSQGDILISGLSGVDLISVEEIDISSGTSTTISYGSSDAFIIKKATTEVARLNSSGNLVLANAITGGSWEGTAIGAIYGGTGFTSYATGDIIYASASNILSKLAAGTNGHVLTLASGVPTWASAGGGISGLTSGRVPYANSSTTLTDSANLQFNGTALNIGQATAVTGGILNIKLNTSGINTSWHFADAAGGLSNLGLACIYNNGVTPNANNFVIRAGSSETAINAATRIDYSIAGVSKVFMYSDRLATAVYLTIGELVSADSKLVIKGGGTTSDTFAWKTFDSGGSVLTSSLNNVGDGYFKSSINTVYYKINGDTYITGKGFNGNTLVGAFAGNAITTDVSSAFVGRNAGIVNTTGDSNAFFGPYTALANTTGSYGTFLGGSSGNDNTTGSNNLFAGYFSGRYNLTGEGLTLLGTRSNVSVDGLQYSIGLGYFAQITASNQMVVGSNDGPINDIYFGKGFAYDGVLTSVKLQSTGVTTGTTDGSAADSVLIIAGAVGTGTGLGGDIVFKVAPSGLTGNGRNALAEVLRIKQNKVINISAIPTSSSGLSTGDVWNDGGTLKII